MMAPVARAIALAMMAGGAVGHAHAQQAFSPAWFAAKGANQATATATGLLPNGNPVSSLTSPQGQSNAARERLQTSIANLNTAAQAIALQQALQAQARQAALLRPSSVPDGLGEGGLKIDENELTKGWSNANAPTQTMEGGQTTVTIEQTADKAILNWETFNVGRNTTVNFEQDANWAVLNRVNDPNARPSQIQGQIKADGTVFILNRNGVVFEGSSQVNVRNLVAAAANITDAQFQDNGLYGASATTPTFTGAGGAVKVEQGALIQTHTPQSVTQGGGYVLLLGKEVENAGEIVTRRGQTALAAGDSFIIRRGVGTDENSASSTRGNEIAPQFATGSTAGTVTNSGLILAREGDITLAGRDVRQNGTAVSTTTVNQRGTIHLLNSATDASGQVTLGSGATTAVVIEDDSQTALDSQRDTLIENSSAPRSTVATGSFNNYSSLNDRLDLSRIEIVSGGNVHFTDASLTLATGGQIVVGAGKRNFVAAGAILDVSGAVGVNVAMESNNVKVNVQGNELRDSPVNRDAGTLFNKNIWVDRRDLILVPAGTGGYESDRWYAAGGLLEVSGYLSNQGHRIGEWAAQGGTILLNGNEVVTQAGSTLNISGGTLDIATGYVRTTWLKGGDGKLYAVQDAPADMLFIGVYQGFEDEHARWGQTDYYYNPIIAPPQRLENGYTVGRDAGRLIVGAPTAVLEGDIVADVFNGARQVRGRDGIDDGYRQAQTAVARAGALMFGRFGLPGIGGMMGGIAAIDTTDVRIADLDAISAGLDIDTLLPAERANTLWLDAGQLNRQSLGGLVIGTRGAVSIDGALSLADGGRLDIVAPVVDFNADVTAHGGSISVTNNFAPGSGVTPQVLTLGGNADITLHDGVTLDLTGHWANLRLNPEEQARLAFLDGGSISLSTSQNIVLETGSLIDVSSGAAVLADGGSKGGKGGSVALESGRSSTTGEVSLEGQIKGYGVAGSGTLTLRTGEPLVLGGKVHDAGHLQSGEAAQVGLILDEPVSVAKGEPLPSAATFNVVMPGQRITSGIAFTNTTGLSIPVGEGGWDLGGTTLTVYVGTTIYRGSTGQVVPAGSVVDRIASGSLTAGYVVPAGLATGIPTPAYTAPAGTLAPADVVFEAGTLIAPGAVFDRQVAVRAPRVLDSAFFQSGFSAYDVFSRHSALVAPDADLQVFMPALRLGAGAKGAATRGEGLELWTPPLYQEDPVKSVLGQRRGASLTLTVGDGQTADAYAKRLHVAEGARVAVDPGQSIALLTAGQLTVDGRLEAPGGRIRLSRHDQGGLMPIGASVWVGEHAVLDAAGRAITAVNARGERYGRVDAGGSILFGNAEIDPVEGTLGGLPHFVVVREGALIDVSGSHAVLDIPGIGATDVVSAGGSITLSSSAGFYLDGTLRGASGGAGAAGGSLTVGLANNNYINTTPEYERRVTELVFAQEQGTSDLAANASPEDDGIALFTYGHARLGADRVSQGGFDTLNLWTSAMLTFDGSVDLTLGRAINLYVGALGWSDASPDGSHVELAAPYMKWSSAFLTTSTTTTGYTGIAHSSNVLNVTGSTQPNLGSLTLSASRVFDVATVPGVTATGGHMTIAGFSADTDQVIDRRAFDQVSLVSAGDMRFGASQAAGNSNNSSLLVAGDLTLSAAQLYPITHAAVTVNAGRRDNKSVGNTTDFTRALTVTRSTDTLPDQPYSVFGRLTLIAPTLNQSGVIRAPQGMIALGSSTGSTATQTVNLLPGSITSVSAAGLVIPYGGTADGISWYYNSDDPLRLNGVGKVITGGIQLTGLQTNVAEGAVIDLSGGGTLAGAGFVSGRGGSTDARYTPLLQIGKDGVSAPSLADHPVYAIVPGAQPVAAPSSGELGASTPLLGQQITIPEGVPGLPAGTYTLLPSTYALLPGAFRVEINGGAASGAPLAPSRMGNRSWLASGTLSIGGTGFADTLAHSVILTPADVLRGYSQYNETSYADYARIDAARLGVPRAQIEADAKTLVLSFSSRPADSTEISLNFDGTVLSAAAEGGFGSTLAVAGTANSTVEILADGAMPAPDYGISLRASDLSKIEVSRLAIGGLPGVVYGQSGNLVQLNNNTANGISTSPALGIVLRSGAELSAPEVMLMAYGGLSNARLGIEIEQGAVINTLGQGPVAYDSDDGFIFQAGSAAVVSVSNGRQQWLAPAASSATVGPAPIRIGSCASLDCSGATQLYSEGSLTFATDNTFDMHESVRYGTRHLNLAAGAFNVGDNEALDAARDRAALAPGLALNQDLLNLLLSGDTTTGAPALEALELIASRSFNFFGGVTLSTLDAGGVSQLDKLVLTTPAIYGYGSASEVARIQTKELVWNGSGDAPAVVIGEGAGTGAGSFAVEAERITFGYGPWSRPDGISSLDRLALGFANVDLHASDRITANNLGTLAVYQQQENDYVPGEGFRYSGGNLDIVAPLISGEAGSVNKITAGGAITVSAPAGGAADAATVSAIGAELSLTAGQNLSLDTMVALPSGKLTLSAGGDLTLGDAAYLDLSGRTLTFFDDDGATRYSWGGDVTLESAAGDIRQSAGATIDLTAKNNQAGRLTAIALGEGKGTVDLLGHILGSASGHADAGGTFVPYLSAGIDVRAQKLGAGGLSEAFAALNQRLNEDHVSGLRRFQLKQGDLVIGNELKANQIDVSLDGGHLTVAGTVDASGERVGSIRLAGKNGLTVAGTGVLDAHGTALRLDSYGKIIDAPNRAIVELNSGGGTLALAEGARIDLRHGTDDARVRARPALHDGRARGMVELYAPRLGGATAGDIAIDASGAVTIEGARSIAVNAVQRYDDAGYGTDPAASGRPYQVVDQDYLDAKHADSTGFIANALANANLLGNKLAGLDNATYRDAFHLRPAVEIVSATPDGDLVVSGDLDLSGYRYDSLNPHTQKVFGAYGSGEAGALAIRAGGDFDIYGSINDGFAPPPGTPDDNGWVLTPGIQGYGADVVVPNAGVVLAESTRFPPGRVLNYDLPIQAVALAADTDLPVGTSLTAQLTVPAGTVFSAAVRDAAGEVLYAAGTQVSAQVVLPVGTRFDAGFRLPAAASLAAMTWPAGVPLPKRATSQAVNNPDGVFLAGSLNLPMGAVIPGFTSIVLPAGTLATPLRPVTDGRMGRNWAVAAMLPEGSASWDLRLVAGADIAAADPRLARAEAEGSLTLADPHYSLYHRYVSGNLTAIYPVAQNFSVLRTGTGSLELLAGEDVSIQSLYGIYTAGTSTASAAGADEAAFNLPHGKDTDGSYLKTAAEPTIAGRTKVGAQYEALVNGGASSTYAAWYPDGGGNLLVRTGADFSGDLLAFYNPASVNYGTHDLRGQRSSVDVGNWLWRQASGDTGGIDPILASWWINFGTYVSGRTVSNSHADYTNATDRTAIAAIPELVGFVGVGTLGGGNLTVDVGGDAGLLTRIGNPALNTPRPRSQGLILAVGGTGRVGADGELLLTGGGDLALRVGGSLNPDLQARSMAPNTVTNPKVTDYWQQNLNMSGVLANLRGALDARMGASGGLVLAYSSGFSKDIRAMDVYAAAMAIASGGPVLMLGDAVATLETRGDLVLGGTGDPGRINQPYLPPYRDAGSDAWKAGGYGWFSLWTDNTAINLFSAGGDLSWSQQLGDNSTANSNPGQNYSVSDGRFVWPSQLNVVAAAGSIYLGKAALGNGISSTYDVTRDYIWLAPGANGRMDMLAGGSILAHGYVVSRVSASPEVVPTPFKPAFALSATTTIGKNNLSAQAVRPGSAHFPIIAFGPGTAQEIPAAPGEVTRIYAQDGDIIGLGIGEIIAMAATTGRGTWYEGAGPVWMQAGRDIVRSGMLLSDPSLYVANELARTPVSTVGTASTRSNLFFHTDPNDVSIVKAGRDILFSSFTVAGPGTLEISAGRNVLMAGQTGTGTTGVPAYGEVTFTSLGGVIQGDTRPGARIVVQAGHGAAGPDWVALLRYLDPANQADLTPGHPLADQPGKVAHTYEEELAEWLKATFGYEATSDEDALARFAGLPAEQQRIFLRTVYYAELLAGGREYNDVDGPRFGSYLRGRQMIAALFPEENADGNEIERSGDIIMFGGAGIRSLFGGDIQLLAPAGQIVVGVEGVVPPASAGVMTQGAGDIRMYSQGSILLGLSRIMTTFGGHIQAWSAEGDINAGRGAKTTVVYTPPRRVYDQWGNVTLSPQAPSTGAGIATLNPIPEVPPGDVDLIAPLGTIDAGEAGIRVSGNANLAALQVVNAENIEVQGEATGLPVVASVNVGALTSASAAANSASQAAQDMARNQTRQARPSVISVQVLGFGEPQADARRGAASPMPAVGQPVMGFPYDPASPVQFVGVGRSFDAAQLARLTPEQRSLLQQE
ncbi:filamentous haemagglutinin family protein [Pseudothauera rhizosphaerae]|nr:filamentous haemagglutinin family protein [Pseudothauera rhizosphaerae]